MRKIVSIFLMSILCSTLVFAQNRNISGVVTDVNGAVIPFASILIKGTKVGATADNEGKFALSNVKTGAVLVISSAGFAPQELNVQSLTFFKVELTASSDASLKEVVVTTGYGIKKSLRSGSSNTQVVSSEKLNTIRNPNINEALAGKVAGIQLRGQSGAKLTSVGAIRNHGANTLTGASALLYVLDGNRVSAADINTDDVEDVSFLQGPAAAAIFGPDGANGAMVITSTKGKKGNGGLNVDINIGAKWDNVYILPNYQNTYAGGDFADMKKYTWKPGQPVEWKALDGKYYPDYSEDVSWGPRMMGQEYIPWYAWYGGHSRSYKTALLTPQPDNARDFYQTQIRKYNTISVGKATETMNMKVTYSNVDVDGLIYSTWLRRNQLTGNANFDLSNKFTAGINFNIIGQNSSGDFNDAYANASSGSFNQWFHRDLDMGIVKELKDLKTPTGIQASWNHNGPDNYNPSNLKDFYGPYYWQNFFSAYDQCVQKNRDYRIIGDVSLTYKVYKDLKIKGVYRIRDISNYSELKVSSDVTDMKFASQAVFGFTKGGYRSSTGFSHDQHGELTAVYQKNIKDFNISATSGIDLHEVSAHSNTGSTFDGFNTPNLFTLGNSKGTISSTDSRFKQVDRAFFVSSVIGYKKYLNFDFTLRNDWTSTLPSGDNNNIFSKSFGLSFIFSDLLKEQMPWLTLGKVRASWGEVPQSLAAYQYPGSLYSQGTIQWNGNFQQFTSSSRVDSAIKGAVATEKTAGIDLSFLKNRIGLSVTYVERINKDFPTPIPISLTSGVSSLLTNAGEIDFKGMDYTLNFKPIMKPEIKWEVNANFATTISNTVVDVDGKPQSAWDGSIPGTVATAPPFITVETATFGPSLRSIEGQQWGQLYGHGIKRDNMGNALLNPDGTYLYDNNTRFGSVLPDFTGGVQNTFIIFKDFTVNVNIDFQKGGKFYSTTTKWGNGTGVLVASATTNDKGNSVRDALSDGGGIHVFGVDATTLKPVDYYVNARDYLNGGNNTFDNDIFDLTFVKLREVSVGYNIPVKKIGSLSKVVQRANFSLVASNSWLIYAKTKDFDPSEIANQSGEGGQFPGLRGFGFNLKVGF